MDKVKEKEIMSVKYTCALFTDVSVLNLKTEILKAQVRHKFIFTFCTYVISLSFKGCSTLKHGLKFHFKVRADIVL
jgi:hypothetical protein